MTTLFQMLLNRKFLRGAIRWAITLLVVGGLLVGGVYAYQIYSVPQVTLTKVVEGPVVQAFYATGTLLPNREYPVKSNVEGTLTEVLVDKGDAVRKGEKLAVVRVEEYLLKRVQAQAELELKKKLADPQSSPTLLEFDAKIRVLDQQLEVAKREFNRVAQLRESGGRTLSEFDKAEENVKSTMNQIEALRSAKATAILEYQRDAKVAQAALDIAQWNIDQQTIVSPIDGVVLDWPATVGTRVKVNDLLMNTADVAYERLIMRVNVDEEDKTRVRLDQTVHMSLYAYPQRVFDGRVRRIYPKADATRRTFEVDVEMMQPDSNFAAGMTGELAFVVQQKENAVVVPSQAWQGGKLWTVRDRRLLAIDAEIGLRSIQRIEILSGLKPGEEVMVSPLGKLAPGREVRTTDIDPDVAAGLNQPKVDQTTFQKF